MPLLISASLFFLSFTPLWVSVIFIDGMSVADGTGNAWTEIISIGLVSVFLLVCMSVMMYSLNPRQTKSTHTFILINVHEEKEITAEYLLSYILPLFAFDFTQWRQAVLFLVFFATLGFLCIRHNRFSVNIVLELLGYRFYHCDLENEDGIAISRLIISKEQLNGRKAQSILLREINNEYSFSPDQ